jgi:hypothetical protein
METFTVQYAPNLKWPLDSIAAASSLFLNRGTLDRAERTKHAAVAAIGAQHRFAIAALIEKLAGVRRHGFLLRKFAVRAGQD